MTDLPAEDLRSNLLTLAVPNRLVPVVARIMGASYAPEPFDPGFLGQDLETAYFDTPAFALRKARLQGNHYLTLRVRCYQPSDKYALSVKTETQKVRRELDRASARRMLAGQVQLADWGRYLPADLYARLLELAGDQSPGIVVVVRTRRFAVEDETDRFTLDMDVSTDTGKCLPANVLEFKSTRPDQALPDALVALPLRPLKLSKFLWATLWR